MGDGLTLWERARLILPFKDITEAEVYARLEAGVAHLWLVDGAACVTEVTDDNMLHLMIAGGKMATILDALPTVEQFGQLMGCDGVVLSGRKGWWRVFPKFGYVPKGADLVKMYV